LGVVWTVMIHLFWNYATSRHVIEEIHITNGQKLFCHKLVKIMELEYYDKLIVFLPPKTNPFWSTCCFRSIMHLAYPKKNADSWWVSIFCKSISLSNRFREWSWFCHRQYLWPALRFPLAGQQESCL
jgi:hypothetical protein